VCSHPGERRHCYNGVTILSVTEVPVEYPGWCVLTQGRGDTVIMVLPSCLLQKFLLSIPGGVFSPEGEEILLKTLTIGHKLEQYDSIHE